MLLRRFLIRLRMLFTLLLAIIVAAIIGGLIYLHEAGFNKQARDRIAQEMERYGIYAEFDTLRFHIIKGLTANNVTLYRSPAHESILATLPDLAIHVDKTKMMRGKLKINTISLKEAALSIPLVPNLTNSPIIDIEGASGTIHLPSSNAINTTDLTGSYEGIKVNITCNLWGGKISPKKSPDPKARQLLAQRYTQFLAQLRKWQWSDDSPPELTLFIEGDLSSPADIEFDFDLNAAEIEYLGYPMEGFSLSGDIKQYLVTIDKLDFTNQDDDCHITADYHLIDRDGRFRLNSSIHWQNFARTCFNQRIIDGFSIAGSNRVIATGSFQVPTSQRSQSDFRLTGSVDCQDFSYKGTPVQQMNSDFSWRNGDLYLDKLKAVTSQGTISGRIIAKDRTIRYQINSDLPTDAYEPFVKSRSIVKILAAGEFNENSTISLSSYGAINQDDRSDWSSSGSAKVTNFSYNGVPIASLEADYSMDGFISNFYKIKATLDYSDYPLKKQFNGPSTSTLEAQQISFDRLKELINIQRLTGKAWPAPVLRMFNRPAADHIEDYRFQRPPMISASGDISLAKGDKNSTRFLCGFTANTPTKYHFLNKDVEFTNLRGQVVVLPGKVQVNRLTGRTFRGDIAGHIHVDTADSSYTGRVQWNKQQLGSISKTYEWQNLDKGRLTGAFTFRGVGNAINTLNGHGNLALENGDLFSIPVFGPLSKLVDGVLRPVTRQKMLHEEAKDFSANFSVKKGVVHTQDFSSMTKNMTFTGEGWVDLNDETIDLTIRMNFRGVLGLAEVPMKIIELPLQTLKALFTGKKVKGLRQFHGTGKLQDSKWKFTPFQPPRNGKDNPIFRKPPRAKIVE